MQFEKVQLDKAALTELYRHSIVVLDEMQKKAAKNTSIAPETVQKQAIAAPQTNPLPIAEKAPANIKYFGGFNKKIAIVLNEHFNPTIAEDDLEMLNKLLVACKLSTNDVAIINLVNNTNTNTLWQQMPADVLIMFDVDAASIGLPFQRPHFEIQKWANATFLQSPALEAYRTGSEADIKVLKTKLWNCFKSIFLG
jgi:hypothetical protein